MVTKTCKREIGLVAQISNSLTLLAIKGQNYQPSRWEKYLLAMTLHLLLLQSAMAQGGTSQALASVQSTIITIVQVIFSIVLVIGLIRVVMKFVNGTPDALSSLGWLVGGVVLWFGFQFFKDDLVTSIGGTGGVQ